MCLGESAYPAPVAELSLEAIAEAKAPELSAATPTSEGADDGGSTASSRAGDEASSHSGASASSGKAPSQKGRGAQAPGATCDELARLQEKQRQVLQLLHISSFPGSGQGTFSRQVSTVSTASLGSAAPVSPSPSATEATEDARAVASGQPESARRFAELRARYLQCAVRKEEQAAPPPPPATVEGAAQGSGVEDLLQVLMAQVVANHVAEMGELRKLQEGLVGSAEHQATRAELQAALVARDELLLKHRDLLLQHRALQDEHAALLAELQAQAPPATSKHGSLGLAVAAAAATCAVLGVMRARH